ncbi:MAG: glycogen synthase, partial [Bacteroidetes bacterium QH_10_64_19]
RVDGSLYTGVTTDPERREAMGTAARQRVEEQFSWRAIAEQTLDFYKSLIG